MPTDELSIELRKFCSDNYQGFFRLFTFSDVIGNADEVK